VLPSVVICDPELTVGMPKIITVGTGMDAFAHCLEAFSSPHYHPMSQGIALEGMRLVKEYLPRAVADPTDLEARAHMMSAAMMGATAFQKGLGYNTHHGMTNAVVIPACLELNRPMIDDKLSEAANYLGIAGGFNGFYDYVLRLRSDLGVPNKLRELGVGDDRISELTEMALQDPSCGGNPVELTTENVAALFRACI
jgi:alcohol dehydrogenase